MPYINFQKEELTDLGFSLEKEILLVNHKGAYYSSTLANCNTRKYHGLLVAPQPEAGDGRYVLLSALDEMLIRGEKKFHLGTHRYPNVYFPQGYKHLTKFLYEQSPKWTIKAGDVELTKEILLAEDEDRILIRYTVKQADAPLEIRFDPFLAYRSVHNLNKSNMYINKKLEKMDNGINLKLYTEYSNLFIVFSRKPDFVAAPDWYYNVEYTREQERGYNYSEDLYSPGYFKLKVKKGDQVIFSAGTSDISSRKLNSLFERELKARLPLADFNECLENAAEQFVIRSVMAEPEIMAGYHWFGPWGRDTFISLPGLTLCSPSGEGNPKLCKEILDANLKNLKNGLFPNVGRGENAVYNSADASLWFFWALQQYTYHTGTIGVAWEDYGDAMKSILDNYRKGTLYNIHMENNGLLYAGTPEFAVTWMDAVADGKPVTPRTGFAVDLNALWYNAIRFALECAEHAKDKDFTTEWFSLSMQIELSFVETFWNAEKGYLADSVNGATHDWSLRPNQVFATSLPFSPVTDEIKKAILKVVEDKLLTPRGLRTLSPEDENYKGIYDGNQYTRDHAYHQGTVWPWLLGHFAEATLKLSEAHTSGAALKTDAGNNYQTIADIYQSFEPAIMEYGIGSIAEIYDGDAPHNPKGTIAQAWSVAELLRIREMLKKYSDSKESLSGKAVLQKKGKQTITT